MKIQPDYPVKFSLLLKRKFGYYYFNNRKNRRCIMEYKIVSCSAWATESAIKVLEKKVNDFIKEGWEPVGGFLLNAVNGNVYQAIIKRDTSVI
jgi:hypothetical protein